MNLPALVFVAYAGLSILLLDAQQPNPLTASATGGGVSRVVVSNFVLLDSLRVIGLIVFALIVGAWVRIMLGSYLEYRRVKEGGGDADLRLHIWLITISYLIFVGATAGRVIAAVGEPLDWAALPPMLIGGPIGLYALWLFMRPQRRNTIRPDDRTTTLGEK